MVCRVGLVDEKKLKGRRKPFISAWEVMGLPSFTYWVWILLCYSQGMRHEADAVIMSLMIGDINAAGDKVATLKSIRRWQSTNCSEEEISMELTFSLWATLEPESS